MDSPNIGCSWCAEAHVSIHSCVFYEQKLSRARIDRTKLCRILVEGIPEEGVAGGETFASRGLVYTRCRTSIWDSTQNTRKQFKISPNQILPTLCTLPTCTIWCMAIFLRSSVTKFVSQQISPNSTEKSSDKTKTLTFLSRPKTTPNE